MYNKVMESKEFIQKHLKAVPKVGIILGSGLGDLVNVIEDKIYIDYKDIPNFPQSTVKGHAGRLVSGTINGVPVLCMEAIL